MSRYKIIIEYDGTDFVGWQRQDDHPSIQEEIETAIKKFSDEQVTIYGSGRTDAGVHALGQVAHFDLEKKFPADTILNAINHYLPENKISILSCEEVDDEFHARFDAKERRYKYLILNRRSPATLENNRVWHIKHPLNVELMQHATKLLVGKHDFTSLKTSSCQAKLYTRTVNYINISKEGEHITIEISAPSFIHNMVRNIVGMLYMIGSERWTEEKITSLLEAKDPSSQKVTAPACGLYFEKILF